MDTMFSSLLGNWLNDNVRIKVKASTYDGYDYRLKKYIKPFFEDKKVQEITVKDIQNFTLALVNEKTKRPLAPTTIHGITNLVSDFFDYCIKKGMLSENPCQHVVLPKKKQKKIVVLSKREQKVILKKLGNRSDSKSCLILVALYTGMRLGELCSLKWECLDMKNKVIVVRTSKRRLKNGTASEAKRFSNNKARKTQEVITTPKTNGSEREIPITSALAQIFEKLSLSNGEYVFPKRNGGHYDNRSIQRFFSEQAREFGIVGKSFHTIRHTFATMAIESNMDIKTLSIVLGHSNVNTTLNLYVHPNESHIRKSMEALTMYILK